MTNKKIYFAGIISLGILCSFVYYKISKNDILLNVVQTALTQSHYTPLLYNDSLSDKIYKLHMKRLDYYKKFLTQPQVDSLKGYQYKLDEAFLNSNFDFFNLSNQMITRSITEKDAWVKEILAQPISFNNDEYYETDRDKSQYAKTNEACKDLWRKMLKYQVLAKVDEILTNQEKLKEKKDTAYKVKIYDSIEVDARRKVLKSNKDWFKRLQKITLKERLNGYINALVNSFDPHSEYMAPKEKKQFDQTMSGQFEGIGAKLNVKDGIIKINEIIIGSPSHKQGELKAGDEIHKVAQADKEPVDVINMDLDEAIELIRGKKGSEVRLTVKRPDGTFKVIPIIRDVIEIEETFVKSATIQYGKKYGYIYLPVFYSDFTKNGARHCSNDMRIEIEKLKQKNIEGLVVDLRDNGGGSLQEVVDMMSLFGSSGPVVQVKSKDGSIRSLLSKPKSDNTPTLWNGPLALLINHGSASASEILAAAVQDYKRGIILGTPSFGKGTVQVFFELDNYLTDTPYDTVKPIGAIKVTNQKFYRISGKATQLKGVTPDINLPDPYEMIDIGEKQMDYPLKWDVITPATYTTFNTINYAQVAANSKKRIAKSIEFKRISKLAIEIKSKKDDTKYSLNMDMFRKKMKALADQSKEYTDAEKEIKNLLIEPNTSFTIEDTVRQNKEKKWAKNLQKDQYLFEAVNILQDLKNKK